MDHRNGKVGAARRPWLILGGAAFFLMVAALLPAHWLRNHSCDIDAGTDCEICLHLDGNPVDSVVPYTPPSPMVTSSVAPVPALPRTSSRPPARRGRAPPVVDPVN